VLSQMLIRVAFVGAVIIGGFGVVVAAFSYGFGSTRNPGPGFFPCFVGLSISGLAMLIFIAELKYSRSGPLFDSKEGKVNFWLTSAALILWVALLNLAGFLIMTSAVTFAISKIFKLKGILKPFLLSAGTTFLIYVVFEMWFYTDLPRGLIG
jgi:hypothetical protein